MKWLHCFVLAAVCLFLMSCHNYTTDKEKSPADFLQTEPDSTWALIPFRKMDAVNPILEPDTASFFCPVRKKRIAWEDKDVFNPAIVIRDGKVYMLYRAEDKLGKPDGTSRIGLAESTDGLKFTRSPAPVLYPDNDEQKKYEWEGGCEDPRITEDGNGTYYMTYTAFDGLIARLMVATSKDLWTWVKHGPAFSRALHGKYLDKWSKSGSIVSTYINGKVIAAKIGGKFWMYWGDQNIWIAQSDDLVNWVPLEMKAGEKPKVPLRGQATQLPCLKIIVPTRPGKFDSDLVESGPTAMLTDKGILLIYNSRNLRDGGDSSLPEGTYAAGQILLDKHDPTKILKRMDTYFIKPDKPYEISGQVSHVCFVEGLAEFNNKWFLYYGTADSKIAVAVKN